MYIACRELGLSYTLGIGMNSQLWDLSDGLLKEVIEAYEQTWRPQQCMLVTRHHTWCLAPAQTIVLKIEAYAQGTTRHSAVTNRPTWHVLPVVAYDEHAKRAESEDRNRQLKPELNTGCLSDHRFMANFFRFYLHAAALNLLQQRLPGRVIPSSAG